MAEDKEQLCCCEKKLHKSVLLLLLHKGWFWGFTEANRNTYWQHCNFDPSVLSDPQISTFRVYSSTKSQLLHVFDNYKFTQSIHIFAPAPPSLFILSSSSYSAHGHKSPFCCFSGLARHSIPPLVSSSSWLTAGARPQLTFVISNPAGSAHKKSVVNSLSGLIPPLLFWWRSPRPPLLFSTITISLLGFLGILHFSDCHIAFYHHGLQFGGQLLVVGVSSSLIFFYLQFKLSFFPFSLSLTPPPLRTPPLCIIYSHFLAIKIELCCRIFACSATLQHWWIILHPANWRASLSFMLALCWFTIKTYCTVLWVEA